MPGKIPLLAIHEEVVVVDLVQSFCVLLVVLPVVAVLHREVVELLLRLGQSLLKGLQAVHLPAVVLPKPLVL
jgi:hypothetical protein